MTFIFFDDVAAYFFVCICYLRHTASYRSMIIGSQEIYKRVMGIIENEAPTIKAEVFGLLGDSYQTQEFDTKFKELWEFNWKLITQEVRADITVFIKSENTWANDEKN